MPRLRLPRIRLASLRDRVPSEERFVLAALVAAFVVVIGVVAGFVLIAANSGGGEKVAVPQIPTITNAGDPGPVTTIERAPERPQKPLVTTTTTTTTTTTSVQTHVQVVRPKPKPPKPVPRPPQQPKPPKPPTSTPPPDDGGVQTGVPYERCSPEGAKGVTKGHRIPLVCKDGRWHFVGIAR